MGAVYCQGLQGGVIGFPPTHMHTHACTHIRMLAPMHKHLHTCTHMHTHAHRDTRTCMYIPTCIYMYIHICMYTFTHPDLHVYAYVHTCTVDVSLEDVLVFVSGCDEIPIGGFERWPQLEFEHTATLPTVSTCSPTLRLPTQVQASDFSARMQLAILGSLVWPDTTSYFDAHSYTGGIVQSFFFHNIRLFFVHVCDWFP